MKSCSILLVSLFLGTACGSDTTQADDAGESTTDPGGTESQGSDSGDSGESGVNEESGETGQTQCWTHEGDVQLRRGSTQAALDAFGGVCEVTGSVYIQDSPGITDLAALSELALVGDNFSLVDMPNVATLAPLASLREVKDRLELVRVGVADLVGLGGLERLRRLRVWEVPSIDGLPNALTLDADGSSATISLHSIENLTDLTGIPEITVEGIGGDWGTYDLDLYYDDALSSLEGAERFYGADPARAAIWLYDCDALTDLSGLESADALSRLTIGASDGIGDLTGLDSLVSIGGLAVSGNAMFTNFEGAPLLTAIGDLRLGSCADEAPIGGGLDNPLLTDFTGLEDVTSIELLSSNAQTGLASLGGFNVGLQLDWAVFRYNIALDSGSVSDFLADHGLPQEFNDNDFCGNMGQAGCNFCPPID
jgi:hypothetical protein